MENKQRIRPLTPTERKFAEEKYHLITDFLKRSKLDAEEFFDIVVFDFLLSVEIYLNSEDLQNKCNFEAFSYMYMKRAIYRHFREQKALKRSSEAGADISFDEVDAYILKETGAETEEAYYEFVEDSTELEVISKVFEQMLDDIDLKYE